MEFRQYIAFMINAIEVRQKTTWKLMHLHCSYIQGSLQFKEYFVKLAGIYLD
jgi:hypothetical protein